VLCEVKCSVGYCKILKYMRTRDIACGSSHSSRRLSKRLKDIPEGLLSCISPHGSFAISLFLDMLVCFPGSRNSVSRIQFLGFGSYITNLRIFLVESEYVFMYKKDRIDLRLRIKCFLIHIQVVPICRTFFRHKFIHNCSESLYQGLSLRLFRTESYQRPSSSSSFQYVQRLTFPVFFYDLVATLTSSFISNQIFQLSRLPTTFTRA
jgi:hypothetical protein